MVKTVKYRDIVSIMESTPKELANKCISDFEATKIAQCVTSVRVHGVYVIKYNNNFKMVVERNGIIKGGLL